MLASFRKSRCDQLTRATLYNRKVAHHSGEEKKDLHKEEVGGRTGGRKTSDEVTEKERRRIEKVGKVVDGETSAGRGHDRRGRREGRGGVAVLWLAFQADSVNRVHYFLVISFYNSGLLS